MTDKIAPALTPEEWGGDLIDVIGGFGGHVSWGQGIVDIRSTLPPERFRHALAALALHGQPFGFTREDVGVLREDAALWATRADFYGLLTVAHQACMTEYRKRVSLAARIEALLPPEGA